MIAPVRILRRPAVRISLVSIVATAVAAGMTVTGLDRGYPAEQVRLLSGSAWLASSQAGQVTLLDGSSAEVAAQLKVASAGNRLEVVQHGATAYAIDQTAGTIRRIDGATFELTQPESPIPDARGGLTAYASPETVYALDTQRGILTAADPRTLAARGQPLSLAAQLETGSATVDDAGRLWAVDNANGDLISIAGDRRTTYRNAAKPGSSQLTLAGGHPVIIDRGDRKAIVIDPETGEVSNTIGLDLRPDDSIAVSGSPHSQRLYLVASRGLLAICDLDATTCDGAVPLDASNSELGPAVEAGNRLFVPDYTTGKVWIFDLNGRTIIAKPEVLTPPARFQLLTRDGIVFYNDPASERAGIIDLNGGIHKVAKYDPKNPDKGLSTPPTDVLPSADRPPASPPPSTAPPPPTAPNQLPTRRPDQPLPSQPPQGQPPPGRPTNPPSVTQPPASSSPTTTPLSPVPGLRITLSDTTPEINQNITLRVDADSGPPPTGAVWDFGDGSTDNGVTVSNSWAEARTYQVGVRATLPDGRQTTASLSVQVSPAAGLPAPSHISPADGTVLTNFPRDMAVTWTPVIGAVQYFVEVECLHCIIVGQWMPEANTTTGATSHSFTWPGDNDGRWRVTPIASDGTRGASSAFWQFRFFTGPVDLLAEAPNASWRSGAGALQFNGSTSDSRGFAIGYDGVFGNNCRLEDGSAPSYMETHPEFTPGGWIDGTYTLPGPISAGQRFRTTVGYIMCGGQTTQGIDDFSIWAIMPNGQTRQVYTTRQTGTDLTLTPIDVDLTPYAGATKIRLRVDDGPPNGQDWACWVAPRIER